MFAQSYGFMILAKLNIDGRTGLPLDSEGNIDPSLEVGDELEDQEPEDQDYNPNEDDAEGDQHQADEGQDQY